MLMTEHYAFMNGYLEKKFGEEFFVGPGNELWIREFEKFTDFRGPEVGRRKVEGWYATQIKGNVVVSQNKEEIELVENLVSELNRLRSELKELIKGEVIGL